MTVKNALVLLDIFITRNNKMAEDLVDPSKSWNCGFDFIKQLSETMANLTKDDIKVLELFKKQLLTNCKHPKKMRDREPGVQWYCIVLIQAKVRS